MTNLGIWSPLWGS